MINYEKSLCYWGMVDTNSNDEQFVRCGYFDESKGRIRKPSGIDGRSTVEGSAICAARQAGMGKRYCGEFLSIKDVVVYP